jgi:hypothetical protein
MEPACGKVYTTLDIKILDLYQANVVININII